ncbi:hypothetical protein [uncultured Mailhella sp.]|uniref:hypothetical protein n=1 Tax=uncultured Mailhella sp. TaxID=1981031 RepID=UPI0025D5D9A0|nr:hypothetical protein [uncultured Mailhella sp.]
MKRFCKYCNRLLPESNAHNLKYCCSDCAFKDKTVVQGSHIIWTAATVNGIGRFCYQPETGGKPVTVSARKYAYMMKYKVSLSARANIRTTCGRVDCVNPKHLKVINPENIVDGREDNGKDDSE